MLRRAPIDGVNRPPLAAAALLVAAALPAQGSRAGIGFTVANPSALPRTEIVRVSLPVARGEWWDARGVRAGGAVAAAVALARWGDGSIAVLQAHVEVSLAPQETRDLSVEPLAAAIDPPLPAAGEWTWPDQLPLRCEVEDPWGQVYVTRLVADPDPDPTSSALVRVRRCRGLTRRGASAFFGVLAYVTEFRGEQRGELTLVLDNRAHVAGPPLGPARFRRFALVTESPRLRFRPRFAAENALVEPTALPDGCFRQDLLGPSDQLYLGDRTAKAFRFDLFLAGAGGETAPPQAVRLAVDEPLRAWPDLDGVRQSRAFGAHGGPAPAGVDRSWAQWLAWRSSARFGPFAGHGDPEDAAAQGTPRNGPSALHDALRWRSRHLLAAAETMALQQSLRPSPAAAPRLPAATAALRQGLSRRCIGRPHGFTALDYEHFSVDLLYDWYWLTGDPLARDELARTGAGLRALLPGVPFATCRGEGWCMQAAALIARATGERELVAALHQRFRQQLLPALRRVPHGVVLPQLPHDAAFGPAEAFDAPWQMAAFVHGLHALWLETADPAVAAAAVDVARVMAGPGWVEGIGPKSLISALQPERFALPVGFGPLQGTAAMEVGAFVLAAEMADDRAAVELFWRRAREIATAPDDVLGETARARWLQLYSDRQGR